MDTRTGRRQPGYTKASLAIAGTKDFNFELWASHVRNQMLTALQKTNKSN
jgi:hypothetical protein